MRIMKAIQRYLNRGYLSMGERLAANISSFLKVFRTLSIVCILGTILFNTKINITKKEFDILSLLMSNQGRVYTSEIIYNLVWKDKYLENDNSVIMHIRNIREKLGDKVKESIYIKTIWGVGYKVEKSS